MANRERKYRLPDLAASGSEFEVGLELRVLTVFAISVFALEPAEFVVNAACLVALQEKGVNGGEELLPSSLYAVAPFGVSIPSTPASNCNSSVIPWTVALIAATFSLLSATHCLNILQLSQSFCSFEKSAFFSPLVCRNVAGELGALFELVGGSVDIFEGLERSLNSAPFAPAERTIQGRISQSQLLFGLSKLIILFLQLVGFGC